MLPYRKFLIGVGTIIIFLIFIQKIYSIPIVPNEQGFGIETVAGRGGEIYKVTNLNSFGSGSLRECINQKNARICVFEISGTIYLQNNLEINNPYITIAGQTAPSPGITIAGAGISVKSHDVLIEHVRIRVGDKSDGPDYDDRDAIIIGTNSNDVYNVVINHVSASWATDEIISTWSERKSIYNITIINSIFSEALHDSYHPDGKHSMGMIIGKNSRNIFVKDNLFAYNNQRNPLIRDDSTDVVVINNFIYGSGSSSKSKIYIGTLGRKNIPLRASIVGNVYVSDSKNGDNYNNILYIEDDSASDTKIYLEDNFATKVLINQWDGVLGRDDLSIRAVSAPIWTKELFLRPSKDVEKDILLNSGARPIDRDIVDLRVVGNVKSRIGQIIDSQEQVGGFASLEVNRKEVYIPKNPNNDDNNNGYTNFEEVLHMYSYNVEVKQKYVLDKIIDDKIIVDLIDNKDNLSNTSISKKRFIDTRIVPISTYFYLIIGILLIIGIVAIVITSLKE